jgi:hypothetical protein
MGVISVMTTVLVWCASYGRAFLIVGLLVGLFIPDMASILKAYIPHMAVALLFLAAFRVGPQAAFGALFELRFSVVVVLLFQIGIPFGFWLLFGALGWNSILASTIVLLSAGASVSASPHLTLMCGHDPAPALRLLVLGTALLPLTIVPVLWMLPQFGNAWSVILPASKLLAVIGISALVAFSLRYFMFDNAKPETLRAVDGLSSIFLLLIVIGLMAAVGPALKADHSLFFTTLAAAFAVNFGLQLIFYFMFGGRRFSKERVSLAIVSGNRNMALFLTAFPVSVSEPMLLFIGCYQIPMYLTPILLRRLYRSSLDHSQIERT